MSLARIRMWIETRGAGNALCWGLAAAILIEAITCILRFGLDMQSTRDTGWMAALTGGFRVHHGYIGLALLLPAAFRPRRDLRNLLLFLGVALLASDVIHHFLVLWPVLGSPSLDVRYPGY